jgi:virginiamycin B lyase
MESRRRRLGGRLLGASLGLIGALVLPAAASAIDEFPLPAGAQPGGIATGSDGALWITDEGTNQSIIRMTANGVVTNIFPLAPGSTPDQIVSGPDRKIWFTNFGATSVGRVDPANPPSTPEKFPTGPQPSGITVGPDNASLWFTEFANNQLSQMNLAGTVTGSISIPTSASEPSDIAVGPDQRLWFTEQKRDKIGAVISVPGSTPTEFPLATGAAPSGIIATGGYLWFTEAGLAQIGRISTGGQIDLFGPTGADPSGIAVGRDGALWFTMTGASAVGRIETSGRITNQFPTPTPNSSPSDITVGPDGALWFTEFTGGKVGRIQTAPPAPPPPPPPPPVVALSVSSLRLSPSSFKAAPNGASITKKAKGGTTVIYSVSAAASTKFTVESVQTGRKSGRKCVKPQRGKSGKKCTRYVLVSGSFKHAGKAGSNKFHFSGRIGSKKLSPGKYRLVAVATVGTRKSKLKRADFKIVR